MGRTVCEKNKCSGCKACISICPRQAIEVFDEMQFLNAVVDEDKCIDCHLCENVCPMKNEPELNEPILWNQGWSNNAEIRKKSTSGGLGRQLAESFINNGGKVCTCVFENDQFKFELINTVDDLYKIQGSKYVKSNPDKIYIEVKKELQKGEKVLFIGLPCQADAVRRFVGERYKDKFYTVDLICHGTPSVKLLEKYLCEHNLSLESQPYLKFRDNGLYKLLTEPPIEKKGIMDKYMIAFFMGHSFTENCYQCKFAQLKRGSDITIGDSWGSDLSSEVEKGISLILCQTEKGKELLKDDNLDLFDVDLNKAIHNNPQLRSHYSRPKRLNAFYDDIKKGKKIDFVVYKYVTKKCIKEDVKKILIMAHLRKN